MTKHLVPPLCRRFPWFAFATFLFCGCATPKASAPEPSKAEERQKPRVPSVGELAPGEPHSPIAVEADDATWGSSEALVTLVAFLDFQCSFCAQGYGTLLKLRQGYSEKELRIVFKHMPLDSHEYALASAVVAQAIQVELGAGAFFEFAGRVFSRQSSINYENLASWAQEVGLDRSTYNQVVGDEQMMKRIVSDVVTGQRLGVDATPTFFINGSVLGGAQPISTFRKKINDELSHMRSSKKTWKVAYRERLDKNMKVSLVETLLAQDPLSYELPVENSPSTGPRDAAVTMVMFSDFECPFCKQAEETVWQLKKRYDQDLRVVFKHMPLPFHQSALPAARLSVLVHRKYGDEAFFALSRDLFATSPTLDEQTLRQLGRKHGLTAEEVDQALTQRDDEITQILQADQELGQDVLARGTPHFFINGKRLPGARPIEQFEALIDYEKKRALALIDAGTKPENVYAALQEDAKSPGRPKKVDFPLSERGQPSRGPMSAPVVVHMFSDFECPYCRRGEQLMNHLEEAYPNQLRFVWHDFPLPFHERALPAARAAREAYAQKGDEAFWKMHDALFSLDQPSPRIQEEEILDHARAQGLDVARMKDALSSDEHDADIESDMALAEKLGINGTPAYVVGGYLVTGAGPESAFRRVIELRLHELEAEKN